MLSKVITGNPGVGKHTVAKQIAKRLSLDLIDINKVAIQERIFEESEGTFDVDVKKLKKNTWKNDYKKLACCWALGTVCNFKKTSKGRSRSKKGSVQTHFCL